MIRIKLTNRYFSSTVLSFFVCLFSLPIVKLYQPSHYVMQGFPFHTTHFHAHVACGEVLRTERNLQPDTDDDLLCLHSSQTRWHIDAVPLLNT